jgi:molybdopterin synthase catalytic subunit
MRSRIVIQKIPFDLNAEVAALAAGGAVGAVASFTGHVRAEDGLTSLTLEHYPGMTEAEIARMAADAAARWPLTGITVIHRVGDLKPGDAILLVAAASGHRADAFLACKFLMDYLKTRAPFWKQETRHGQTRWMESRASDDAAMGRWRE